MALLSECVISMYIKKEKSFDLGFWAMLMLDRALWFIELGSTTERVLQN